MYSMLLSIATQPDTALSEGVILSLDKSLIINIVAQIINVAVLTVLLVLILYKPVKKYLSGRTQRIKQEIEDAEAIKEEAFALKEEYQKLIANIEGEREELLRQTHKKAMEKSDHLIFEARREADVLYKRAMADLELERKNINDEMNQQMVDISYMMASRFVKVSIDEETQNKYIDQALADWDGGVTDA